MRLAFFAALGVVATHTLHLILGNRIATRALAHEIEVMGRTLARTIAQEAMEAVLVNDDLALNQVVDRAVGANIVYCFVVRKGAVLASSFSRGPPWALVDLVREDEPPGAAVIVRSGSSRFLDVAEPILGGSAGVVRLGIDMRDLDVTTRSLVTTLVLVALAVILAGVIAALVVGRLVARPIATLAASIERFDPAEEIQPLEHQGTVEVVDLIRQFNRMMLRVKDAHDMMERARKKGAETERLVALGALVAGLAHEINNPLTGIKNCHRRLSRGDLPDEKRAEYFDMMADGIDRIEGVVARLLDFARPQPLSLSNVLARDLVRDAGKMARPLLERRRIQWEEDVSGVAASAIVIADRRQVGQALLNLILNAAYVTPDMGAIHARVVRRPGLWGIAIADEGPGIPPALRERVLDPFFSTKPEGEGTGLGLPVTRTIVGAHGGELTFDFPDAGGTIVTIWLRESKPQS